LVLPNDDLSAKGAFTLLIIILVAMRDIEFTVLSPSIAYHSLCDSRSILTKGQEITFKI